MEFTPVVKEVILNYLKDGQREMALQYIRRTFHTSEYDSRKLLETFEAQFNHELKAFSTKKFDSSTCSGCLSRILKIIAILIGILGIGILVLGYFFVDWFGHNWNSRRVPVIVIGMVYSRPDSSYINLIYEYRGSKTKIDTSDIEYDISNFHAGDTINVSATDLGIGFDEVTINTLQERQQMFYLVGGGVLFTALIFLAVASIFKIRPPSNEGGRYLK